MYAGFALLIMIAAAAHVGWIAQHKRGHIGALWGAIAFAVIFIGFNGCAGGLPRPDELRSDAVNPVAVPALFIAWAIMWLIAATLPDRRKR